MKYRYMSAMEEGKYTIAQANAELDKAVSLWVTLCHVAVPVKTWCGTSDRY